MGCAWDSADDNAGFSGGSGQPNQVTWNKPAACSQPASWSKPASFSKPASWAVGGSKSNGRRR